MKKIISYLSLILIAATAGYFFLSSQKATPEIGTSSVLPKDGTAGDDGKTRIIAVGDSLTAGFNLPLSDSYPMQLEKKLVEAGANVEVINAGISGETSAGLLERATFIVEQNPDILLISIGGNDAFRNLPVENTKSNIEETIKIFKQSVRAENIYLLQIEAGANRGLVYRNKFNGIYKEIAKKEKVQLLPFVVKEVFLDSSKMLSDAIHPNKEGYKLIVDKYIFPVLSENVLGR